MDLAQDLGAAHHPSTIDKGAPSDFGLLFLSTHVRTNWGWVREPRFCQRLVVPLG